VTERFTSYTQNFEDVMLWRALQDVRDGFYIDVGASWPTSGSTTLAFYERGWHGINIEPDAETFAVLVERRPRDLNLQLAVSNAPGQLPMYFVPNTGNSTLSAEEAEHRKGEGHEVVERVVHVATLASIWNEHVPAGQPVHFLKIDVEGTEHEVLDGLDLASQRPWILVVEATLPNTREPSHGRWEPALLDQGYELVHWDGINRFYVAREHSALSAAFELPPNYWDHFIPAEQRWAEGRAREAERRARKAEANLERLRRSWSWRLTRPLRVGAQVLRRLRRGTRT
jgi:FkbM family methyltransferase